MEDCHKWMINVHLDDQVVYLACHFRNGAYIESSLVQKGINH